MVSPVLRTARALLAAAAAGNLLQIIEGSLAPGACFRAECVNWYRLFIHLEVIAVTLALAELIRRWANHSAAKRGLPLALKWWHL